MKLNDEHLYHGAALIQIAEHDKFTAINTLKTTMGKHNNIYGINDDIAIYIKYATKTKKPHDEYQFTFKEDHLSGLEVASKSRQKTFVALICMQDREVCCVSYDQLKGLISRRLNKTGSKEEQYVILVKAPEGKSLRVYVNAPNVKNKILGKSLVVRRNAFPNIIF